MRPKLKWKYVPNYPYSRWTAKIGRWVFAVECTKKWHTLLPRSPDISWRVIIATGKGVYCGTITHPKFVDAKKECQEFVDMMVEFVNE